MKILSNYCGIGLHGDNDVTYLYANYLIGKYVYP